MTGCLLVSSCLECFGGCGAYHRWRVEGMSSTSIWARVGGMISGSMMQWSFLVLLLLSWSSFLEVASVELTFELPDNAKECFHENIKKDVSSTFEFQVSN